MIRAQIEIAASTHMYMGQDEIKDHVLSLLSREIANEVAKQMTITSTPNHLTMSTTYTGTLSNNTVGVTTSGFNGVSSTGYSKIILRVVEYTKNGSVTKVELQQYDEQDDSWLRIPRIQIEET